MNRLVLDASSATTGQIRNYMKNTELSDSMIHPPATMTTDPSTAPSVQEYHDKTEKDLSFALSQESSLKRDGEDVDLKVIVEDEFEGTTKKHHKENDDSNHEDEHEDHLKISEPKEFSYQNKLKYLPNADFQDGDSTGRSFQMSTYSPLNSIPNTFKYKSHPNARTKLLLGGPRRKSQELVEEEEIEEDEDEGEEEEEEQVLDGDKITNKKREDDLVEEQSHMRNETNEVPMRTSTIKEHKNGDTTPNWMPDVLNEKWHPPGSVRFDSQLPENEYEIPDFGSSVRITRPSNRDFDLHLNSTGNTMIHNSKAELHVTPEWMKASKEYAAKKAEPFENIFLSVGAAGGGDIYRKLDDSGSKGFTMSSTTSSPIPSLSEKRGRNGGGISPQIGAEDVRQIVEAGSSRNPESPLKLFHDKYNTYTKDRLTEVLQKVHNKSPAVFQNMNGVNDDLNLSKEYVVPDLPEPKMKIKNFTRSGSYTEREFLKNADDVFKGVQKRGFMGRQLSMRDVTNISGRSRNNNSTSEKVNSQVTSNSTSTSTPKNDRVRHINELDELESDDDYSSSFTSGFEDDQSGSKIHPGSSINGMTNNEYTSFELSSLNNNLQENNHSYNQLSPKNLKHLQRQLSTESNNSYTYDGSSEEIEELTSDHVHEVESKRSNQGEELESIMRRLQDIEYMLKETAIKSHNEELMQLRRENEKLRHELDGRKPNNVGISPKGPIGEVTMDTLEYTVEDLSQVQDFIRWKRPSQLTLGKSPDNFREANAAKDPLDHEPQDSKNNIVKGRLDPNLDLPREYNNMILDIENQKWINNEVAEASNYRGSLDSIEDLVSQDLDEGDAQGRHTPSGEAANVTLNSTLRLKGSARKNKLEVSFHLPNLTSDSVENFSMAEKERGNVTNVSQLGDATFSQTKRRLVNVITEILPSDVDWNKVRDISLSKFNLENIKELDTFLPRLTSVDLSNNEIKYTDGILKKILNLDISNNLIDNISSFAKFHDLQVLKASHNQLGSLSSISNNIHLTELLVNNNKLTNLDGIQNLTNLIRLDVSQNDLVGDIDFQKFNLKNLQELNLSENNLRNIIGLENLPNLRVINLNENRLQHIDCKGKHPRLKKLLFKLNKVRKLDLEPYPCLRVLRMDGNAIDTISDIKKSTYLEEISCKSQSNLTVVEKVFEGASDIQRLDISGNTHFDFRGLESVRKSLHVNPFLNLNTLVLSAMNLTKLPENFGDIFPNVRDLNLNFNKLNNIEALSKLSNVRKLYMVSNRIDKVQQIVGGLFNSRKTLRVLDMRLNQVNIEFYPYVFNKQELEYSQHIKATANIDLSPIQLETLDDIESFAILYQSLNKSYDEWVERDSQFLNRLQVEHGSTWAKQRLNYETLLINLFLRLKKLDGSLITSERRDALKKRLHLNTR